MRKLWPGLLALVAVAIFGFLSYSRLPEQVATHWNLSGEVDGWSSRTTAVFFVPVIGLAIAVLLAWLPKADPKRANFPMHENVWWLIGNATLVFMALVHLLVIGIALGWGVSMDRVLGLGLGGLFVIIGNSLTRVRQNWFLGIRTPWTLSSERSWRETHRLGGTLFVLGGLFLIVATTIGGRLLPWVVLVGAGVPAVVSVVYSYLVWKKDQEKA